MEERININSIATEPVSDNMIQSMESLAQKQSDFTGFNALQGIKNIQRTIEADLARGVPAMDVKVSTATKLENLEAKYRQERESEIEKITGEQSNMKVQWDNFSSDVSSTEMKKTDTFYRALPLDDLQAYGSNLIGTPEDIQQGIKPYLIESYVAEMRNRGKDKEADSFYKAMQKRNYQNAYVSTKEYKNLQNKLDYIKSTPSGKIRIHGGFELDVKNAVKIKK